MFNDFVNKAKSFLTQGSVPSIFILSINHGPWWTFKSYQSSLERCRTENKPGGRFLRVAVRTYYDLRLSNMDFPRSRSPDISKIWRFHFLEPYKLNWKLFNVLSKMTKRIKLMQWIYYLVTWKIKMIPDIKIGDYWSGRFFKSVTTIESTN